MRFLCFILFFVFLADAKLTFDWDCSKSAGACQNYCYAARCRGLNKMQLTLDKNQANRSPRRRASGCSKNPCKKNRTKYSKYGSSCDEFPFASVKEGGKGAHLRCVAPTENSSEGGQLSAFYRKLNDGDKFGITVKNFKNAPSCNTNKCKNDGGQFKMNSQGNFVNDKRSLDQGRDFTEEFVDDTVQGDEDRDAAPLRMLESDDGTLHLIILEDVNDPIGVGDELWTEDGTVRVSRLLN